MCISFSVITFLFYFFLFVKHVGLITFLNSVVVVVCVNWQLIHQWSLLVGCKYSLKCFMLSRVICYHLIAYDIGGVLFFFPFLIYI